MTNVSNRERAFWRRLDRASRATSAAASDLFALKDAADRRRHHLALIVQRKTRLLGGVIELHDLDPLNEEQLGAIRKGVSARIAFLKKAA